MLKRLEIDNLFGEYSYVIDWKQSSNKDLLYITGPNGMGKTTILRMIDGLYPHLAADMYANTPFSRALFVFDGNKQICLERKEAIIEWDEPTDQIPNKEILLTCVYSAEMPMESIEESYYWRFEKQEGKDGAMRKIGEDGDKMTNMEMLLDTDQCRFFKDDRIHNAFGSDYEKECIDPDIVSEYLRKLQMNLEKSFVSGQYGIEIREWMDVEKREELDKRRNKVLKIMDLLKECDIYIGGPEQYKNLQIAKDIDLLLLLNRLENAIRENKDDILKLQTYVKSMKRFGFIGKELRLSPIYGYRMVPANTGIPLKFEQLASGEKHLICLLNGLFFVKTESPLVLIDEPEMSYHMYWQYQFCKTMKEVVKLMHLRLLIATHQPQMFDDDFSLTVDLWEQWDKQRRGK